MPVTVDLVCLANSRKMSGHCVAGKVKFTDGSWRWVRPVSDRPKEEVSFAERRYVDRSEPRMLDVIRLVLREPRPKDYQVENWLLDPTGRWSCVGRASRKEFEALVERPAQLWINGFSSHRGQNDRIPLSKAKHLTTSLTLVELDGLVLNVASVNDESGNLRRPVRAAFQHRRTTYSLRVTDPVAENACRQKEDGSYPVGPCYVTVSLGEPFDGHCYKLVAGIIVRGRQDT